MVSVLSLYQDGWYDKFEQHWPNDINSAPSKCCQYPPLQFLWTKICSTWPDNDRNWLQRSLLAHFRRKMAQLCLWPKSAPSSDSFWVHRLFNVCVRVFCVPNAIILLTKIKMSFIWKDDFFFCQNRHLLYKSMATQRKDKTNYLSNQTWTKW